MSSGHASRSGSGHANRPVADPLPYPIARRVPQEELDAEVERLNSLATAPVHRKIGGYARLLGPGVMTAALTLGAGTLTTSMVAGATYGYRTLWLVWLSAGLGLFLMAASARFTCRGGFRLVKVQNQRHGWLVGSFATGLLGCGVVAVAFNFPQVTLGTHLIESLAPLAGFSFPAKWNWLLFGAVTAWLSLSYGRKGGKGTRLVEGAMKSAIALMFLAFGAVLLVVGVDWGAAAKGFFVPWLPGGGVGLDMFIATTAAAVVVMDWVLFNYAGLVRGWGRKHERLARIDIVGGLFVPFVVVNFLVISVFARTDFPDGVPGSAPELASALVPLLGETWSQIVFYIGFLAVPVTSTVMLSVAGAMAIHEAFGWEPDTTSVRWRTCILLPQIALLSAALNSNPIFFIIAVAAAMSIFNTVVGWSMYLLLNDRKVLGEDRSKSYLWNLGILLQVTLLNGVAITWVFNRLGLWGS